MRLFIAIPLAGEAWRAAVELQDALRLRGVRGNYTKPENLHLTLAFIGEYGAPEAVRDALDGIPFSPFDIALDGIGAFGDLLWLGLKRSEPLEGLVKALRHALAEAGIPFDRKRFTPHITLVRRAEFDSRAMKRLPVEEARMTVDHVALMRSDRGKSGMIYTEIT